MEKLFARVPAVNGAHILPERLSYSDIPAPEAFAADQAVYRRLPAFLFERQYADKREMIDRLYGECFRAKESLILGIYLRPGRSFCDPAELYGCRAGIRKVCIGYRLRSDRRGKGIAAEAVALPADYLFSQTDIENITASTMPESKASARVLEKNGFIRTANAVPEDWGYAVPTPADKWSR